MADSDEDSGTLESTPLRLVKGNIDSSHSLELKETLQNSINSGAVDVEKLKQELKMVEVDLQAKREAQEEIEAREAEDAADNGKKEVAFSDDEEYNELSNSTFPTRRSGLKKMQVKQVNTSSLTLDFLHSRKAPSVLVPIGDIFVAVEDLSTANSQVKGELQLMNSHLNSLSNIINALVKHTNKNMSVSLVEAAQGVEMAEWRRALGQFLETKKWSYTMLTLLFMDISMVFLHLIADSTPSLHAVEPVIETITFSVICFFCFELFMLLVSFGPIFFQDKGYVLDLIVVPMSLVLEKISTVGRFLIILRLWRVLRVMHRVTRAQQVYTYKSIRKMEREIMDVIKHYEFIHTALMRKSKTVHELVDQSKLLLRQREIVQQQLAFEEGCVIS